jgi:N-acetylneuraminic acid mutarotase
MYSYNIFIFKCNYISMKRFFKSLLLLITFITLYLSPLSSSKTFADIGSWQTTTSLPVDLASHISQVYNDNIYVVGGANTGTVPENISSIANSDGTLQSWTASSTPSPAIFWHTSVLYQNYVYLIGGTTYPPGNSVNTVYVGTINQGTISSWTPLNSLPVSLSLASAVVVGNTIYVAGGQTFVDGNNGQPFNQTIYAASINSDGTIGNWTQVGSLPTALTGFGMIAGGINENKLIIIGGSDSSNVYHAETYTAPINSNGTIGTWQQTASLPEPLYRANIAVNQGIVYAAGGALNNSNYSDNLYYSTINSDGTLGSWIQSQTTLPQPICCGTLSTLNGYLYLIGGYNNDAGYLNTVYYSQITKSEPTTLTPSQDSFIQHNEQNSNEGKSPFLELSVEGKERALIQFNESQIQQAVDSDPNYTAILQLTIVSNNDKWGSGRQINLNRMEQGWTEGNGSYNYNKNRGTGSGVTWDCATDDNITNQSDNCSGSTSWDMIDQDSWPFSETPTATTTITNNQSGTISFNVTSDIKAFLNGTANNGWIIMKDNEMQDGDIQFGSKESIYSPKLIITPL